MAKYLFIYHGDGRSSTSGYTEEEVEAWREWLESMGDSVVDGGSPIGKSSTLLSDGTLVNNGGSNPSIGYGLVEAISIEDAVEKAKKCPILTSGGSVEIGETYAP